MSGLPETQSQETVPAAHPAVSPVRPAPVPGFAKSFLEKFRKTWNQRVIPAWRRLEREYEELCCYIREYQTMRLGKRMHTAKDSFYLLRRNIHRLEKGLLHRPVRKSFGQDYLAETVRCYTSLAAETGPDWKKNDDMLWARDVLNLYFSAVPEAPFMIPAKQQFLTFESRETVSSGSQVPFRFADLAPGNFSYSVFLELVRHRHSVRVFLPKKVRREDVDRAVEAARFSPSACNRQPFRFHLYDDPELVQKISSVPMGTAGFSHTFPMIAVLTGQQRAFFHERDRHLIYIDGSLAAMTFMLALESQGLSSCPINWPDIESREKEIMKFVPLAEDEKIIMLIAAGYADPEGLVAYSRKKSIEELRDYNSSGETLDR